MLLAVSGTGCLGCADCSEGCGVQQPTWSLCQQCWVASKAVSSCNALVEQAGRVYLYVCWAVHACQQYSVLILLCCCCGATSLHSIEVCVDLGCVCLPASACTSCL